MKPRGKEMQRKGHIGAKIKKIREFKKIGIEEGAQNSQLKRELIQRIEEGKANPSLSPLIKIARSLGVRLGTFLDDHTHMGPVIVRGGEEMENAAFSTKNEKTREHLKFYSLAQDKSGRHMEPFIISIEPGNISDYKLSTHEGEEFIYVLEGSVEINYGKDIYRLDAGDSIYLDSVIAHNVHAANEKPARILGVVYAPY